MSQRHNVEVDGSTTDRLPGLLLLFGPVDVFCLFRLFFGILTPNGKRIERILLQVDESGFSKFLVPQVEATVLPVARVFFFSSQAIPVFLVPVNCPAEYNVRVGFFYRLALLALLGFFQIPGLLF